MALPSAWARMVAAATVFAFSSVSAWTSTEKVVSWPSAVATAATVTRHGRKAHRDAHGGVALRAPRRSRSSAIPEERADLIRRCAFRVPCARSRARAASTSVVGGTPCARWSSCSATSLEVHVGHEQAVAVVREAPERRRPAVPAVAERSAPALAEPRVPEHAGVRRSPVRRLFFGPARQAPPPPAVVHETVVAETADVERLARLAFEGGVSNGHTAFRNAVPAQHMEAVLGEVPARPAFDS